MAGAIGIEPILVEPKSTVLPLNDAPIYGRFREITVFTSVAGHAKSDQPP